MQKSGGFQRLSQPRPTLAFSQACSGQQSWHNFIDSPYGIADQIQPGNPDDGLEHSALLVDRQRASTQMTIDRQIEQEADLTKGYVRSQQHQNRPQSQASRPGSSIGKISKRVPSQEIRMNSEYQSDYKSMSFNDMNVQQVNRGLGQKRLQQNRYQAETRNKQSNLNRLGTHTSMLSVGSRLSSASMRSTYNFTMDENNKGMQSQQRQKCQFTVLSCHKRAFQRQLCREHFCSFVRQILRKTLSELYKQPDLAFGLLDPEGLGYLTLELFLNSYVTGRSKLTPEEMTSFFEMQNIFKSGQGKLSYAKFRELFFPHMTLAGEDPVIYKNALEPSKTLAEKKKLSNEIQARIRKLNAQICFKISRNFTSVNKAFLTLDQDHDGWIEPKDIVAVYGAHIDIDYADLIKIMENVSSRKDGTGRINYADFSLWLGNEIHNLASFIFRHDSKRNPQFDKHQEEQERRKGMDKRIVSAQMMDEGDILQRLIRKIQIKWRTVRNAFKTFNEDGDKFIRKEELIRFLETWGFPISKEQAEIVFKYFDKDGDGLVSYQDFVLSIGFEIHPSETLYFRQEKSDSLMLKDSACDFRNCWASVVGRTPYCMPHLKQNQEKILKLYANIHTKVTRADPQSWPKLLKQMEAHALPDDKSLIKMDKFEKLLAKFHIRLQEKQRDIILKLHGVLFVGDPSVINLQPLYDVEKNKITNEVFAEAQIEESNEELKADLGGYFGDFHRHRVDKNIKNRVSLTEKELVEIMLQNDRLKEIALAIRHIDPDRNGFVTQQELDDIFRENYRNEMQGKHIFGLIKDFRSISNKILVDYGKFKKWVFTKLKDARKEQEMKKDPKLKLLNSLLNKQAAATREQNKTEFDEMQLRLNKSIKRGRLTEDLLSEVASFFDSRNVVSPHYRSNQKRFSAQNGSPRHHRTPSQNDLHRRRLSRPQTSKKHVDVLIKQNQVSQHDHLRDSLLLGEAEHGASFNQPNLDDPYENKTQRVARGSLTRPRSAASFTKMNLSRDSSILSELCHGDVSHDDRHGPLAHKFSIHSTKALNERSEFEGQRSQHNSSQKNLNHSSTTYNIITGRQYSQGKEPVTLLHKKSSIKSMNRSRVPLEQVKEETCPTDRNTNTIEKGSTSLEPRNTALILDKKMHSRLAKLQRGSQNSRDSVKKAQNSNLLSKQLTDYSTHFQTSTAQTSDARTASQVQIRRKNRKLIKPWMACLEMSKKLAEYLKVDESVLKQPLTNLSLAKM